MRRTVVLLAFLVLMGCTTDPVVMRNPQTGQTAQCGPYYLGLSGGEFRLQGIAMRESQCINDWKEQGYVRLSGSS